MTVGALVLAAGVARRFGSDKRLYPVEGKALLLRTLEAVTAAGLPCRVCLRPGDGALPLMLGLPGLEFIECRAAARGMGATLAEGVRACHDWDGLLVVLGDMAWVTPATLSSLARTLDRDSIVQPVLQGKAGNPVGFGQRFFAELEALDGDRGGRSLLTQYRDSLKQVDVNDPGVLRDLDEPPNSA